jgi:hypothetical protein
MRIPIVGVLLTGIVTLPAHARAQTKLTLVPSVAVSAISDDNIFSTASPSADQTTLVSPGVQGSVETPRATLLAAYSIDMLRSADFAALNDLESRRHGTVDAAFRQSPRLALNAYGRYDRSDEVGALNFETGVLLPRARATRWESGPSFTYKATPLVTINGQYTWVQESLASVVATDEQVGRFLVSRQLSARASVSAGFLGRRFVSDMSTDTSNAPLAGASYELRPFTRLTVQGGPRFSSTKGLEPEVVASLTRRAPNRIAYSVDGWRGESIILGVIGPVEVTSATGRFAVPIRRRIEVGGAAGVFESDSLFQGDARVYHTQVVASWTPRAFYSIAASYATDFQHGDIRTALLNDSRIVRHVFLVQCTVAPRVSRTIESVGPIGPLAGPQRSHP